MALTLEQAVGQQFLLSFTGKREVPAWTFTDPGVRSIGSISPISLA